MMQSLLSTLTDATAQAVWRWVDDSARAEDFDADAAGLSHPLSHLAPHFARGAGPEAGRTRREAAVAANLGASLQRAVVDADSQAFLATLEAIVRSELPEGGLRDGPVRTTQDACRQVVVYPSAEDARLGLLHLHARLRQIGGPPVWAAVAAMFGILNCHPVIDGSGRLARIAFNALGPPPGIYIPLHDLWRLSRGGFQLYLREAEIHGRWSGLLDYMLACIIWMSSRNTDATTNVPAIDRG